MKSLKTIIIFLIYLCSLCFNTAFGLSDELLSLYCPQAESEETDYAVCEFTPFARQLKNQRDSMAALLPQDVAELSTLFSSFDQLLEFFAQKRDEIRDLQRWAKGEDYGADKNAELQKRWDALEEGLIEIEETQLAINRLEQMLQVCRRGNCGAQRRVELEDELKKVQNLQQYLIAQNPWWVGEELLNHLGSVEVGAPKTSEQRKRLYIFATAEMASHMSKIEGGLHSMKLMEENALEARAPKFSYSSLKNTYLARHPEAYEFAVKYALINGQNSEVICPLAQDLHSKNKMINRGKVTAEVGLLVAGLVIFPESAILSWTRLGKFMGRVPTRVRGAASLGADAGFAAFWYNDWNQLKDDCQRQKNETTLEIQNHSIESYQQCLDQAQNHLELGLLLGVGSASLQLMPRMLQRVEAARIPAQSFSHSKNIQEVVGREQLIPKGGFSHTVALPNERQLTFMDLSASSARQRAQIDNLPDEYWDFVGDVYTKQLNLTAQEVKSFVQTSKEFAPRTKLITMTRGPPKPSGNQFDGGIGFVESSRAQDLLPLEKATGITLNRGSGKSIEIVRLTSTTKDSPELMKDLLHSLSVMVKHDPEIEKVYVYTSKIHQRLYRRLGIEADSVQKVSDRDVIIEVSREKFLAPLQ